ncbi:MAG: nucleotide sugar dehydrogenase [Acidimicrobiia bacterium]|nr:nucleotide sugar dehydrogenase [Acidimicrobiia bacterium]
MGHRGDGTGNGRPVIGFAGLSHLGLVSSAAAADRGFDVIGYDADAGLVRELADGRTAIVEPGLPDLLARTDERRRVTTDPAALSACDLVYVSVDVPTSDAHASDVSPVVRLVETVAGVARPGASIIVLSQVPPGFTRALVPAVDAAGRGLRLFYQVETLAFGTAVERALHPERFIFASGDPGEALPPPVRTFLDAFGCPILHMRYESAELCKIAINMFLASTLATTNMLAEVCEVIGAEWREIAPALKLDRRIGPYAYLAAGLGIGGGNITRDMATIRRLAGEAGTAARIVDAWSAHSEVRRDWPLRQLEARVLPRVERPVVAVWGLAYKEHTQFTKNSPALSLVASLRGCEVRAFDPGVDARSIPGVTAAADALDACRGADALAVMTAWPEFADVDLAEVAARLRGRVIVDPLGRLDLARAMELGFEYVRLGSPAAPGA